MTTPPTTAGWYPDPDGSGGQRYWDGAAWTAQRPDAPESTEETSAWPAELPPWPEDDMAMPSWEDAGKNEPPVSEPETSAEPEVSAEPETPAVVPTDTSDEPEPAHDPVSDQTTTVVQQTEQPTAVVPLPRDVEAPSAPGWPEPEQPTAVVSTSTPPPVEPVSFAAGPEPAPAGSPLKKYLIGVGALAAVLVGVLVWAFAFADPGTDAAEATGTDVTTETGVASESADPTTDSAAPAPGDTPAAGSAVDGDVTITQNGVEIVPTVSAIDNEFLTKTAAGQFVIVKLNLVNNGQSPATFLSDQQVLTVGGQPYSPDTEATFYLNGISAVLYPGQPVDVTIAFDVPSGSTPESIRVLGDLGSPGALIPLS
ncbi:DUF4352 domain-containing protein [Mycolicibacterium bacteremicum]|uniref:DUF4352 domain-containing protein n=1 Tax=Mycolicibacterium bacteremicum TaxID=564198 RepID=A0A1W9Z2U5_MYCBA|nr:DUF4352 domain-containing protein [Mycolicibacterium bacteremicum]ORA06635.1 hypothetical protein BST17_03005 [Mycolicibacterium bacteremicum]